jgi:hypothetical protein
MSPAVLYAEYHEICYRQFPRFFFHRKDVYLSSEPFSFLSVLTRLPFPVQANDENARTNLAQKLESRLSVASERREALTRTRRFSNSRTPTKNSPLAASPLKPIKFTLTTAETDENAKENGYFVSPAGKGAANGKANGFVASPGKNVLSPSKNAGVQEKSNAHVIRAS